MRFFYQPFELDFLARAAAAGSRPALDALNEYVAQMRADALRIGSTGRYAREESIGLAGAEGQGSAAPVSQGE